MLETDNSFIQILALIFNTGYRIVTSINIPGTNINLVEIFVAGLVIFFVLKYPLKWLSSNSGSNDGDNE